MKHPLLVNGSQKGNYNILSYEQNVDCWSDSYKRQKTTFLAFSKNKKTWYLPGGKVDANESSIEAIQREVRGS
jgi:hypothetical protein